MTPSNPSLPDPAALANALRLCLVELDGLAHLNEGRLGRAPGIDAHAILDVAESIGRIGLKAARSFLSMTAHADVAAVAAGSDPLDAVIEAIGCLTADIEKLQRLKRHLLTPPACRVRACIFDLRLHVAALHCRVACAEQGPEHPCGTSRRASHHGGSPWLH